MYRIMQITDFNASELDVYARLNEAQLLHYNEPEDGLFIAESPKVIERALQAGYRPVSFLMEEKHIYGEGASILAQCPDIPVYTASFDILTQLTGFALTRGMLAAMKRLPLPSPQDICRNARRIAILEDVVNPTNVGAIFRSAAALNMDAILLTPACSNPLYRRSLRVSMGCVFQIPWSFIGKKEYGGIDFSHIHELNFKTAAMALDERAISIDTPILSQTDKLAIVLGTEGDGLAASTISNCDYTVRIPMSHGVDSLNVAAASAVAFWALGKPCD